MAAVIALGGSVLNPDQPAGIRDLGTRLARISKDIDLYIVTGGGKTARTYIQAGRALGADEPTLDKLGIVATRLNAWLLKVILGDTRPIPASVDEGAQMTPPVVMGGTVPGHSTDAVGARLARSLGAERFIIATDVDGIYTADPRHNPQATRYGRMTIAQLEAMCPDGWDAAGTSTVVDGIACRIIAQERIPTFVLNGTQLDSLENAIYGREFIGTVVEV
jgi:uridylate kinase